MWAGQQVAHSALLVWECCKLNVVEGMNAVTMPEAEREHAKQTLQGPAVLLGSTSYHELQ